MRYSGCVLLLWRGEMQLLLGIWYVSENEASRRVLPAACLYVVCYGSSLLVGDRYRIDVDTACVRIEVEGVGLALVVECILFGTVGSFYVDAAYVRLVVFVVVRVHFGRRDIELAVVAFAR